MTPQELTELERLAKKIANVRSDDFGHSVTEMLEWVFQESGNLTDAVPKLIAECRRLRAALEVCADNDFKIEKTQAVAKHALEHKP